MFRRPPECQLSVTLFPSPTLFRSSPWTVADAARLAAVRADRAAAAERYFASQAERWDAIRSLHISENEVEAAIQRALARRDIGRSEEHTSELQSLMRISYAVFCLKKKNTKHTNNTPLNNTFI